MAEVEEILTASQRSKIRRLSAPRELAADEEGGELNIVPFLDIIMNVMMFVLATVVSTFTATIDTTPPRIGGGAGRAPQQQTLNLTVLIVPDGFGIKARGGNIASGCNDVGPGIAVPKVNTNTKLDFDFAGLAACVRKLKDLAPEFADETNVTVTPNPEIPYSVVIAVMDAIREDPSVPADDVKRVLFPDVSFGLAGR